MGQDKRADWGDIVGGVCNRPPDQEKVDEDFCRQLEASSKLQVIVQDFNSPDICWRSNTTKHKQPRRLLD